ncbi:arfaptin-1 isoform X1 [Stegostoma tigrinum]|uniref:arfaptin-1 isoform X1 n=3 Tax=Stegostoma tigrinum TaxID=3053191 RepID=UPI00202B1E0E|nr:arfaptin-1 isoform X1 [Stegostoma tigrinum]XP_048390816.1 arfaptin-1 isoform X1 [Stegostoma tigrinum]XP_048390825.1 arfaptin-1 isoform X1 [Stegostoma tigrinum]XP_048390829.1 arfaptin-1 isoform X1 [Stegostoma tigrinum]XP_059501326.1 arfaptin-1 isoform X1 [Stegostoma tigrinum]
MSESATSAAGGAPGLAVASHATAAEMHAQDSESGSEESEMAEPPARDSAAEIPVTSNGDASDSQGEHKWDVKHMMTGGPTLKETRIISSSYGSSSEGIIEAEPYRGSSFSPKSPVMFPSNAAATRLAEHASDVSSHAAGSLKNTQSGPVVITDDISKNIALEKLEQVKKWSISTYKCTRQVLSEKLGRGSKTVDLELESQIEILRETKKKYENLLRLARQMATQFYQVVQTQRQLGDAFGELSVKSPELHEEFGYNAETQKLLCKNGETLLGAINFFIASVNTLVNKTIEDTLIAVKHYENARIEYDAYRTDLEELNLGPRDAVTIPKIEQSQQQFQIHKEKFDKLRGSVSVKLKFLDENKIKVMHNQLLLFHNAVSAYFAGNQQQLEQVLKQFHIKLKAPGSDGPSWLEEQ